MASRRDDRIAFLLSDPKRLQIAEWCGTRPRSEGDLVKLLGKRDGGVSAPKTMRSKKWGALVAAGTGGPRGAKVYKLAPGWRSAVKEARRRLDLQDIEAVGAALDHCDFVLIRMSVIEAACRALTQPLPEVLWAAPTQGEAVGLMLCVARGTDSSATARVVSRLASQGVEPGRLSIDHLMTRDALAEWANRVLDDTDGTAAPAIQGSAS